MRQELYGLVLCIVAMLATACPKGNESIPENLDEILRAPKGNSVLVFSLKHVGKSAHFSAKANMVKMRLEAFGIHPVGVKSPQHGVIRVELPTTKANTIKKAEQLITRPSSMAIAPVMQGKKFFEELRSRLGKYPGLKIASDYVGIMRSDRKTKVTFLLSDDEKQLLQAIGEIKTPKGSRLVPMYSTSGAMAFLIPDPPSLQNPILTNIHPVIRPQWSGTGIGAKLARPYREAFSDLVRANLNRPLAFIVNGQVVAVPVVSSKIRKGSIEIAPSPTIDSEESKTQAKRLAVQLKSWQLVGSFKLVAKRVSLKR